MLHNMNRITFFSNDKIETSTLNLCTILREIDPAAGHHGSRQMTSFLSQPSALPYPTAPRDILLAPLKNKVPSRTFSRLPKLFQYVTILVLDNLETKIIPPVLNLRVQPIGAPSKVMMTMTTSMADLLTPRCSPNKMTSDTSSFILKESTHGKSSIRCCGNEFYNSENVLHEIPTSKFKDTYTATVVDPLDDDDNDNFNAVVNLLDNDEDRAIQETKSMDFSTFLSDWEAFHAEFKTLTTYALAHSSAADRITSSIVDESLDQLPPSSFKDSLLQLQRSVKALEEVNQQFAQFINSLDEQAPRQPTLHLDTTVTNQQPCPPPQLERTLQQVRPKAPPPAPNPQACLTPTCLHPPLIDKRVASGTPLDHHPVPTTALKAPPPAPPNSMNTIPNWARPVVPPPADPSPMVGVLCTGKSHWPPPRPERKTIPFKKKSQTKPAAGNRKDFLRPP